MDTQHSKVNLKKGPFRNKKNKLATIGTALGLIATFIYPHQNDIAAIRSSFSLVPVESKVELGDFPIAVPTIKYGFTLEYYEVEENSIQPNQTLGLLLSSHGISMNDISRIVENCEGVFRFSSEIRVNKPYLLLKNAETLAPEVLIYEPNAYEYIVINLTDDMKVERLVKPVESVSKAVEGVIESSLWQTLTTQGISFEAAAKMEDALQWSVDFGHTQKGDVFRMVYDEKFVDGESVGTGQVHAAYYNREGKESYAFWFDNGEYRGYYDESGRAIQSSFLRAPVKYSRISSRYNKRRFHPVLKRVRPHLGTDYAAPYGTPIYAVGNGVVIAAAYTKGNGRYVKIKHDDVYQTQYLHMSKFAKGIKRGVQVSQGEVIGYVGSSGLATGPHVCFRFWKNGRQVNHLRENLPEAKPLPESVLEDFYVVRDHYMDKLVELEKANANAGTEGTAP